MSNVWKFVKDQAEWFTSIPAAGFVWSYSDFIFPIFQSFLTISTAILTAVAVAVTKYKINKYLKNKDSEKV